MFPKHRAMRITIDPRAFGLILPLVLVLAAILPKPATAIQEDRFDPLALYGDRLTFDVWRDGDRVGEHRVSFRRDGEDLLVETQFGIEISFLVFKAYSFDYSSSARWHDGRLKSLRAVTDDDGSRREIRVEADVAMQSLRLHDGTAWRDVPLGTFPTNHWHAGVLHGNRVINTLTGQVNEVEILRLGEEQVETANGEVSATRYAYSGDLETEVWYDERGRWVKMRFRAKDGSTIDYRCRTCGAGTLSLSGQ